MCKHCGLATQARFAKSWCKCQEVVTDGYCAQRPLDLVIHPSRPLRGSDPPRGGYVASSREPPRLGPRRARRGRPSRRLPRVWTARPPRRGGRGRRRAPAGARPGAPSPPRRHRRARFLPPPDLARRGAPPASDIVYLGLFPIEGPFPMTSRPDRNWSSEGGFDGHR